ncbi:hypothetical protein A2335_01530 [Candidatus Peregrinibacteria bacterium RIFOXYB2_FULL_32_7]|nr:MAG: hypothetical protein A2335_01530 [Candidatus Peregrinibacteria bacterium RIFOXYB2_FULL_32_7]
MLQFFNQIIAPQFKFIGGKASSLIKLRKNNFLVPNGFIIFQKIENKKILKAFQELNCQYVAVRSSANLEDGSTNSFAGQFDTFLFVDEKNLIKKISECFNSINSNRIKHYCQSKNIDQKKIKISVIIQQMINSKISGVCFTKHPVSKNSNQIIIEAGYGLGEAIVSGKITPDLYIFDKKLLKIIEKQINSQEKMIILNQKTSGTKIQTVKKDLQNKQKLSDLQILEIAKTALKIEKIYKKEMDIEWGYENRKLYILQARAITI